MSLSPCTRTLTVRLPNSQADFVEELAAASGRLVSHVVRDAIAADISATLAAGAAARAR
jgi:hypothetical protein